MQLNVTLLGTGEAADPNRYNTAYLIQGDDFSIQVDAGYTTYRSLCRYFGSTRKFAETPELILLTHVHGDHTGSLPQELLAMLEEMPQSESKRIITIIGEPNAVLSVHDSVERDYPGFMRMFRRDGLYVRGEPKYDETTVYKGIKISHALTKHSVKNFAYRFDLNGASFAISGDGLLTPESRKLFEGVDLLFHDGFFVDAQSDVHASVKDVFEYAKSAGIKRVGVVHVGRYERFRSPEIQEYERRAEEAGFKLWMPEDHETVIVGKETTSDQKQPYPHKPGLLL